MGYYPQESLYKPYKYHGYTVRGPPNCPLKTEFISGSVGFSGTPKDMGPPYGKLDPYYSHKNP